jgi:hypothetical protein
MDKKEFIFNNYKTNGTYNSVVIKIEDELMKVILLYLANHPEKSKLKNKTYNIHFLKTFYNEDIIKSQEMTRILNKIFGKSVGSSLLRNMYLSNKYSGIIENLKKDTTDMGTSVDVALNNYIKK